MSGDEEACPSIRPMPWDQGTTGVKHQPWDFFLEVVYIRRYSPKTGKPLLPIPYRWHLCDHCLNRALVEHGARSGKPKKGKCVFCGKQRVSDA